MVIKEYLQATNALRDWFKSQELEPYDSVIVCQAYIAGMIVENGGNISEKYQMLVTTTRQFELLIREVRAKP